MCLQEPTCTTNANKSIVERGYRIEDERPIPVNGLCSFIAVRELATEDPITELVGQALKGKPESCE